MEKDNYSLINSKDIAKYCRKIQHKFNTEELAVLVYRNKSMDIEEKIEKYQDLINNYPDMEVIERLNCVHYDSIKTMIKNEIDRIQSIYKEFMKEDENCFYSWYEYNKSTRNFSKEAIENSKRTYEEVNKEIRNYINEFDDTVSYTIMKKDLKKEKKPIIYAKYNVINKNPKLVEIYYDNRDFEDFDGIFIEIPTPFKKGDILIAQNPYNYNYGDNGNIFVLDYLCTWEKNLKEILKKGNRDSSDMVGYGYYLYENKTIFIYDNKWDYDTFEYYRGELTGNNRILKAISSFIKGDINLELFTLAYDAFRADNERVMLSCFTDKGLKLAGFSNSEIEEISS